MITFNPDYPQRRCRSGTLDAPELLILSISALALWALSHSFRGTWHDGILYAAQALQKIYPERFTGDMFFSGKSQDDFSAFGHLFAILIRGFGLDAGTLIGLLAGHIAWLVALAKLAQQTIKSPWHWLGVTVVAIYPAYYDGPIVSIAYAENFLTARIWAEPLVLAGVMNLLRGRYFWAGAMLVGATLLHPIIAFSGLLVALYFLSPVRLSIWATLAGLATAIVAPLALGAQDGPLALMDPEWYALCLERSPIVFLSNWRLSDFREPIFFSSVMIAASCYTAPPVNRMAKALVAMLVTGMLATAVASYWPVTLLTQMQTWRVWWLAKVAGILFLVELLRTLWQRGPRERLTAGGLLACWLSVDGAGALAAPVLLAGLAAISRRKTVAIPTLAFRLAWLAISLVVADWAWGKMLTLALTVDGLRTIASTTTMGLKGWLGGLDDWFRLMSICAILLVVFARPKWRLHMLFVAGILGVAALLAAILIWDRTSLGTRYPETAASVPPIITAISAPDYQVYLEGGHNYLWLTLHRGSYGSNQQAAGMVFSREGAMEASRRLRQITLLRADDGYFARRPEYSQMPALPARPKSLLHVCHASPLTYVILAHPAIGFVTAGEFELGVGKSKRYVYDCRTIRAGTRDPYPGLP